MSLPHYRENGWEPIILAVDPQTHGGPQETELLSTVPPDVHIHHVRVFPQKLFRRLGIGNLGLRSWLHLLVAGWKIIRREKVDLVFISNSQFITFTLGRIWRLLLGVPYVIDLQDPWRTDYYQGARKRHRPGGWKYDLAQLQAGFLEGWSFKRMSGLMSVSRSYIDDLQQRYRWFSTIPTDAIGFGASLTDLSAAAKIPEQKPSASDHLIRMVYTGVVGPVMKPALNVLFDALNGLRLNQSTAANLRLAFLGTSYASADTASPSVNPLAHQYAIDDIVSEVPLRLGHLEALREQAAANVLLLLGTDDPAYSPSKLYPYFLSGRPVLAIVLAGSVLEQQLRELSFATVVTFDEAGSTAETRGQIQYFLQDALTGFPSGTAPGRNEELFRREFLAPALTARQCVLFDAALAHHQQ